MNSTALLAFFAGLLALTHAFSVAIAVFRCRRSREDLAAPAKSPLVSIIRPVCGLENNLAESLRSSFLLAYRDYEIIFCIATPNDGACALVRRLIDEHPHVRASLLIGQDPINRNPKLNNIVKGWRAAASDWMIVADSNVLMPPDYVQRLLAAWQPDTGAVCSPAVGGYPNGVFAELECAFLNSYATRWQYAADSIGFGFAQGKSMLLRRDLVERYGGVQSLARDLAEDAAVTKVVRAAGLRVRLVDAPFLQPLGTRSVQEVWHRQVRWARLRRNSFKFLFAVEIFSGGFFPLLMLCMLMTSGAVLPIVGVACVMAWYGGEAVLARSAGWPLTPISPLTWFLRDLLLPLIWINGWIDRGFVWRGTAMKVTQANSAT